MILKSRIATAPLDISHSYCELISDLPLVRDTSAVISQQAWPVTIDVIPDRQC